MRVRRTRRGALFWRRPFPSGPRSDRNPRPVDRFTGKRCATREDLRTCFPELRLGLSGKADLAAAGSGLKRIRRDAGCRSLAFALFSPDTMAFVNSSCRKVADSDFDPFQGSGGQPEAGGRRLHQGSRPHPARSLLHHWRGGPKLGLPFAGHVPQGVKVEEAKQNLDALSRAIVRPPHGSEQSSWLPTTRVQLLISNVMSASLKTALASYRLAPSAIGNVN
jgi:hypothetical protein